MKYKSGIELKFSYLFRDKLDYSIKSNNPKTDENITLDVICDNFNYCNYKCENRKIYLKRIKIYFIYLS